MSANIMKLTLKTVLGACLALAISACSAAPSFISTREGQFIKDGNPYTYIGTNFWYGPILASDGQGGDYARLTRELDTLKALGVTKSWWAQTALRAYSRAWSPPCKPPRVCTMILY